MDDAGGNGQLALHALGITAELAVRGLAQVEQGEQFPCPLLPLGPAHAVQAGAEAEVGEAAQLRIGDVDWHTRSVSITGKGNKQRRCPLWQSTLDELRSLTEGRTTPEPVFLNRFRQTMTRSGIHALVKRCAARACTMAPSMAGKNVHPHVIRHTTASLLLQAGIDINTIRGWLGHVSLTTTNIYAEINLETKARALAACEVESDAGEEKHWRDQPDLMAFLRTL